MVWPKSYKEIFDKALIERSINQPPNALYTPINYILRLGGKRLRPLLVMMTSDIFGNNYKDSIPAAIAIEIFHNFTLMHDDVMDNSPMRRGATSVHNKWNVNTAILSGDAMLINSYQELEFYKSLLYEKLNHLFSKTAISVCEGQQYDLEFETYAEVSQERYLEMIKLKTAVLIGCALKMGAIIGGARDIDANMIYSFGVLIGIAFQIQDDYLDIYGDPKTTGKQLGGDILKNKKTILYHKAINKANSNQKNELKYWFSLKTKKIDHKKKVDAVKSLFDLTGAGLESKTLANDYTQDAFSKLDKLDIKSIDKKKFKDFGLNIMDRKF